MNLEILRMDLRATIFPILSSSMLDFLEANFSIESFIPHGHCYLWKTGLVGLHIAADALIALAYYSIPITLFYFVRQRKDLPFQWMFLLFGAFIISCGTTHLLEIWTLWYPTYWLSGGIKAITALISVFTAIELVPLIPRALALPSPTALQQLNDELQISQARFSGILGIASDAIISIDANQRITLFNQAAEKIFGYTADEALGQPLDLLLPQQSAALHHQHIRNFKEQNGNTRCMGDRSEIFGRRKDGTEFPAEASISKLEVAGEKIFTAFLRDISERKQAETNLQAQQQFLRQVIDANPNLIFAKDWEGRFTLANQTLVELYNTSVEEIIGKTDADFCFNSMDAEHYAQVDRQVMQTLQPVLNLEETLTTTDGTIHYLQTTKKPLLSPDGQTRYVLGVANDITILKQTEAALQQKTEELEGFFSSMIDLLCIANTEGYFLRLNPEWQRTLGYSLQELEGKCFLDFVHPDDLEATIAVNTQASKQPLLSFTNRYRHQDGSYRWLEWRSVPKGNYIYATARDITDRKAFEEALTASEERWRYALEDNGDGLWDWNAQTNEVFLSHQWKAMLGFSEDEIGNDLSEWDQRVHPDEKAEVYAAIERHFLGEVPQYVSEHRVLCKDGSYKWILARGMVMSRSEDGRPLRVIGTHTDISERKRIEVALKESEQFLQDIINSAAESIWVVEQLEDGEFWIISINPSIESITGIAPHQWIGKRVNELWDSETTAQIRSHYDQCIRQNATITYEEELPFDDHPRCFLTTLTPLHNSSSRIRLLGTSMDITDRKQAEERLRHSENTKRAMIQAIPDLLIRMREDGTQLELINQGYVHFVEAENGLVDSNVTDVLPLDVALERLRCAEQALKTGEVQFHEYQLTVDGQHYFEEARTVPLQGNEVLMMVRDITDRKRIEQALRESESRFRTLIEDLQVGVVVQGTQAEILLCNSKALDLLGLIEAQVLGKTSFDPDWNVIHEDGSPFSGETHPASQAIATGRSVRNVIMGVYRPRQNDRVWLLVDAEPQLDEEGNVQQVICTFSDISERQAALRERERTEGLLRQSEERLRLALKAAKFGTWQYDFVTNELLQSDISEIYGLKPGQTHTTYEEWKAQIHPDDRNWVQEEFDHAIQATGEFSLEFRIIQPDGTVRWTLSTGAVVQDQANQPLYAYGIAADITNRKQAEVEEKAQQAFLRQVIDIVPNIIFAKNRGGHLLVVNQAGADVHGTTVEAMLGKRETDFNPNFSSEQLQEFLAINQQVMETRKPHTNLSHVIVTATGATRWYQTVINPLIDVEGQVTGIVGATTDVTDLKHAQQNLQQAKEAAEAANKAKSIFLANMSHELRTPLNVILGFVQVMQREPMLDLEQQENLQIIRRSGDHLLSLINDVLDLSKIEAGHITLDESSIDLIDLLRSLEQMFRQRSETKGLQLRFEVASNLPHYVTLDANKLRQVLINLLGNAIKFTKQGEVALKVQTTEGVEEQFSAPNQSFIRFEISDTGAGIHPAELETIFKAFVQTQAEKISPDGTGLGLTISRKFVQMMGGDITVQSVLGQGSTFAFTIPVHWAELSAVAMIPSSRQVIGLAPNQPVYRILVVDDQPENRKLLVKLLAQIGLEVREAANGQEAVTQWQHWQPDLIYMDIRMPLLNGYKATQQIRATPNGQRPVIIALTAQASRDDRMLALASGCNDYLSKPFQEEVLFSKMTEHLGLQYVCAESIITSVDEEPLASSIKLHPSDLSIMPPSWIALLHQAARLCDDSAIEHLIEQVPAEQTFLIKGLRQLLQNYSFKQIIVLTTSKSTTDNA